MDVKPNQHPHLLIIRFSSFGDIVHATGVPAAFKSLYPNAKVDWLIRDDLAPLVENHPSIDTVIRFSRRNSVFALLRLAWNLGSENYTHVYDAHSNVRSRIVCAIFRLSSVARFHRYRFVRRPKQRLLRVLLFRFRINRLPSPFRAADSFHRPLEAWGLKGSVESGPQFFAPPLDFSKADLNLLATLPHPWVALVPSAAWKMKRWPIDHFRALIRLLPDAHFVLLGGPEDRFLSELELESPDRVVNLAGRISMLESAGVIGLSELVVANDTGLMHVADQMERPLIALIGPTAFGYPSHATSSVAEIELPCKPCSKDGRGECSNPIYQKCLVDLSPIVVAEMAKAQLRNAK